MSQELKYLSVRKWKSAATLVTSFKHMIIEREYILLYRLIY